MSRLENLKLGAEIMKIASDIWDAFHERKRKRLDDEKDRRIRELEEKVAKLEAAGK